MSTDSSCAGDPVGFVRLSTGANAHFIDYGDGVWFSRFLEATSNHTYTASGNYTVIVVANVGGGSPSVVPTPPP